MLPSSHIEITNLPRRFPLANVQTAYDCNGTIVFLDLAGNPIHKSKMPISWSGNPEPVKYEFDSQRQRPISLPELSLMRARRFMNIPPGYTEAIDVAARIVENGIDDKDAYGWTPECYLYSWRHPDYRIPPSGDYIARVSIATGSHVFTKDFLLTNPAEFSKFDLKPLESEKR